ncbi:MAG: hypothetical protein KDL87_14695, partial [Verrucomicrobiae bacterium]|nr:hypothetical protein [Verrucomicrobiae bacterium]
LILVAEQGIGDVILFMRYAGELARRVPRLSIAVSRNLVALVRSTGLFSEVYSEETLLDQGGKRVRSFPLLSVPGLLGVSRERPLHTAPYVPTDSEMDRRWRERLRSEPGFLVGLNWQGNPEAEQGSNRGRSFPLEILHPLAEIPGVRFVSLQKGFGAEQLAGASFRDRFVPCQGDVDETWGFVETASMMAACDLVITSDTAPVHLAGAIGAQAWLLLSRSADWRWGPDGDRAAWYPSVRLFRQARLGEWESVILEVRDALAARVGSQPEGALKS